MGYRLTRPAVLKALTERAGREVHVDELTVATGLDRHQVQHAMRELIKNDFPVETVLKANMWVYKPDPEEIPEETPATKPGESLEVIGRTRSGSMLARNEYGALFVVTELDL